MSFFVWITVIASLCSAPAHAAKERYQRRAYPGAPPSIPHPADDAASEASQNCLACHLNGDYVAKWQAHAPRVPHPEMQSCRQCHVSGSDEALFKPTRWWSHPEVALNQRALPGGPPRVPHHLHMRGDCLSCHGAGGSHPTSHPERASCQQCHVSSGDDQRRRLSASVAGAGPQFTPGVQPSVVERQSGAARFRVLARSPVLTQFPCEQCHADVSAPVGTPPHPGIARTHPGVGFAGCATCHNPQSAALTTLAGARVSFDHSYQVCAQCHQGEARDWLGGAHGKRAVGWAAERVSLSCTGCHDPHRPGFGKRRPKAVISPLPTRDP